MTAGVALLGVSAALLYGLGREDRAPKPTTASVAAAPATRSAAPVPAAHATVAPFAADVAPRPETLLRAALVRRFHGNVPRELLDALRAGDVRAVAEQLAATRSPGAAAALAELAALCQEVASTGTDQTTAAPPSEALAPGTPGRASLEALEGARRGALNRLRDGCAVARLDAGDIEQRLRVSANAGDSTSLERLALSGTAPGRLESAALLGAPRAQWRLGLDHEKDHPDLARSWLEAAAKHDADAGGYYAACLLAGCFGTPDPLAARAALEAAARHGGATALGLLAAGAGPDAQVVWSPPDALATPLPPPNLEALGLDAADHYAWARFAGDLARRGCFGLDLATAALALGTRDRLGATLTASGTALGEAAGRQLDAAVGESARQSLGCD